MRLTLVDRLRGLVRKDDKDDSESKTSDLKEEKKKEKHCCDSTTTSESGSDCYVKSTTTKKTQSVAATTPASPTKKRSKPDKTSWWSWSASSSSGFEKARRPVVKIRLSTPNNKANDEQRAGEPVGHRRARWCSESERVKSTRSTSVGEAEQVYKVETKTAVVGHITVQRRKRQSAHSTAKKRFGRDF